MRITKTISAKGLKKQWYLIDVKDQILGRVASKIAILLRGKNRPFFSPSIDCGASIVVINVALLKISEKKLKDKKYYSHSKYPGSLKTKTLEEVIKRDPTRPLRLAVKRMLSKSIMSRSQLRCLFLYADDKNPHVGQKPTPIKL